jgi:GntR family transcriptional regulator
MEGKKIIYHKNIPLYYQIESHLRYQIEAGDLPPNAKLPPEKELCQIYEISQGTLRKALEHLEREGFILRKPSKGTFVAERPKMSIFPIEMRLVGFMEDLILHGKKANVKILSISRVNATPDMATFFGVQKGEEITQFKRVKLIDRVPLYYVVNHVTPTVGKQITREDLQKDPPLEIFEKKLNRPIEYIRQMIVATKSDHELANMLGLQVLDPILHIHLDVYEKHKKPLEIVDMYCPGDRYRFVADLTKRKTSKTRKKTQEL